MHLKDLLSDIPTTLEFSVDLPSKGRFYKSFDPKVGVKVTRIVFQTELDLVAKRKETNFNPIEFLLERHVKGVNVEELLAMDRFAILLKLREVSYGNEYKAEVACPNCKVENILNFSLKDFPINYIPDDFKDPREINLPILGKKAVVRFPRKGDLDLLGTDPIGEHLWRFIISINEVEDKAEITELISDNRFSLRDIKALVDGVLGEDFGVQTTGEYKCCNPACQTINEAQFEVSPDFF